MDISLRDAATLLGKSMRQVRYMVQQGKLKADKKGGRWVVRRDDLPLSAGQVARGLEDQARVKQVIETALGADAKPAKRYSVTDLRAFQTGRRLLADLRTKLGQDAAPARRMAEALALITCGCHTFHKRDKVGYFQRAREQVCYALAALLVSEDDPERELAGRIEAELLPALGGTIRSAERRR